MADQFERAVVSIIAALDRINTSIQKTATYKAGNLLTLGNGYTIETVGVGGALGGIEVDTELIGSLTGAAILLSYLEVLTELIGITEGACIVVGALDTEPELLGAIVADATMAGRVEGTSYLMIGSSTGAAEIVSTELEVDTELIGSSVGEASGAAAYMWV